MALTYGFYNSQNGDRVYDADQFSSFLDGIVYDGVYEAVGDKFYVTSLEDEDLTIQVGAGRAWLKHTWTLNDTNLYLNATAALDVYDRIDAVVLEVDKKIRTNSIKIIEGTPSDATPARPDLKNEDNIRQYPLAYIYREHGTTKIPNTHAGTLETDTESATECIKFMVGSSSMPLCSALALAGIPSGGKIGQVLAKSSSESGAVNWYDLNKLPYDKWYLSEGMIESNVIAAYKFIGGVSETEALKPVNENKDYSLTKYSDITTWSSSEGFYIPAKGGLNNTDLYNSTSIVSIVLKYKSESQSKILNAFQTKSVVQLYLIIPYTDVGGSPYYTLKTTITAYNLKTYKLIVGPSFYNNYNGVLGWTATSTGTMYLNGQSVGTLTGNGENGFDRYSPIASNLLVGSTKSGENSESGSKWYYGYFNIEYLALYNIALTDEQHSAIYTQMISDYSSTI